jgi:hypothetical protein
MHQRYLFWSHMSWQLQSATNHHVRFAISRRKLGSCPTRPELQTLTYSSFTVFWSWFPIGGAGIRAVLLFVSSLAVFVLRVGQLHLGSRTTTSSIATFRHLFPLQVAQTFGWYLFSAWWFTEIYLWSSSAEAALEMVKRGKYVVRIQRDLRSKR